MTKKVPSTQFSQVSFPMRKRRLSINRVSDAFLIMFPKRASVAFVSDAFLGMFALMFALFFLGGCAREKVQVYRIVHQVEMTKPPFQMAASSAPELVWSTPTGWAQGAASGPRLATLTWRACQLTITAFPGDAGGLLPNVNRWRSQIQLPALSEDGLDARVVRRQTLGALSYQLVSIENPEQGQALRVGILSYADKTWFFKLSGPLAEVNAAGPAFSQFLASVKPR